MQRAHAASVWLGLGIAGSMFPQLASAAPEQLNTATTQLMLDPLVFGGGVAAGVVVGVLSCACAYRLGVRAGKASGSLDVSQLHGKHFAQQELQNTQVFDAHALHKAVDYEDIAQNYVETLSLASRMAARAQGVADLLKKRLDATMMEGVPVIERADGTVADLGCSWWETSVGEEKIARSVFADDADFTDDTCLASPLPTDISVTTNNPVALEGIADSWHEALVALDEKAEEQMLYRSVQPLSQNLFDDLDEPQCFVEASQVQTVETAVEDQLDEYIEYLMSDELSKLHESAECSDSRQFLRVLEGGTQSFSVLEDMEAYPLGRAKHFA